MSEQFYTAICERCGILFREAPGRCPDCGSDEILFLSACDDELLVLADSPEIKIDQTWWNEEQKRFHRLLRLFWDDLDRLKSFDGTLLSGTKTTEAESEALTLAKRWLTNYPLENYASSLAGIRLRQTLELVTARLRGDSGVPEATGLREMVASLSGGAGVLDSLIPVFEAERDARVRLEEAEAAKERAEAERDEAAQAERKMLSAVGAVRTLFERTRGGNPAEDDEVSDVLRGIGAMRNERAALENAWNAWNQAAGIEAMVSERLDELCAFRNRMAQSPDAVYLDEARKDLSWSQAVSDAVRAADAAAATLAKWHALAPAKPVVDCHPVPWPPFRFQAMVRGRMRAKWSLEFDHEEWRWLLLSFVPMVVGWMMCATGEWIVLPGAGLILCGAGVAVYNVWDCLDWSDFSMVVAGKGRAPFPSFAGFLFGLAAGWILRHWIGWTMAGWLATATGIGVLACGAAAAARAGARKRMRRELLSVRAKWLSEKIAKRWPDSETEKRWNELTSDLEPLSRQRAACLEPGTADSVRFYRWRVLWNRLESLRAWDAVHAQWDIRRQSLQNELSDRVRDVRDAVDAVVQDAVQLRSMNHEQTAAAEEAVETAVAAVEKSAAAFPAAVTSARAAAETAAHGADAARAVWETAKAATDAAVAKAEEDEKRRAEVRIEFARLKDRTVPPIRAKLDVVRAAPDCTEELVARIDELESEFVEWEKRNDPGPDGIDEVNRRASGWNARADEIEHEWFSCRHRAADERFAAARAAFAEDRLDDCIAAAGECLAREPNRPDASDLRNEAVGEKVRREKEQAEIRERLRQRIETICSLVRELDGEDGIGISGSLRSATESLQRMDLSDPRLEDAINDLSGKLRGELHSRCSAFLDPATQARAFSKRKTFLAKLPGISRSFPEFNLPAEEIRMAENELDCRHELMSVLSGNLADTQKRLFDLRRKHGSSTVDSACRKILKNARENRDWQRLGELADAMGLDVPLVNKVVPLEYRKTAKADLFRGYRDPNTGLVTDFPPDDASPVWSQESVTSFDIDALKRDAEGGDRPDLMVAYGCHLDREGSDKEATEWFRRAAEAGDPEGMNNYAALLWKWWETRQALVWLKRAAKRGNNQANQTLNLFFGD